ncbi:MAG: aldo/keto reductase [Gammaproteobacteria bacterium]|nr:aldo/keto reductase [Gammaproteobacteria bacterium]
MSHCNEPRFSRRAMLQAGLLAGVGAALPGSLLAAHSSRPLITKTIPSSGESIPVIGIGTNRFGDIDGVGVRDLLKRMRELGGSVIDTAGRYPGSEERIGAALQALQLRAQMFLITKMNAAGAVNDPPRPPGGGRLPPDPVSGIDSFNRSLQRLQTDRIDLMLAHWLSSVDTLMPLLVDLRKQGRVRYIGITTIRPQQHARIAGYLRQYPVDFVQIDYALDNRSAETEVFRVARERRIAVCVAQPFGGADGGLFAAARGRELPGWAGEFGIASWGQFFLKYVASHPDVTCVIPGITRLKHLEDNMAAGIGRLPDAATRRKMEEFWAGKA